MGRRSDRGIEDRPLNQPAAPPKSGTWLPILGAAALVLATAATVIGYTGRAEPPRLVGQNAAINPDAVDRLQLASHNSPTVVRNPVRPENLAEANRLDRPLFSCALHVSFDGGVSWSPTTIPFPAGEEEPPRCFAPDITFSADGTLHLSFATLKGAGNVPNAIWLTRSTDGGRTLTTPQRRLGPLSFQDRP
ncbi:MAG: glycoside hydrolase [Actinomycetota bacterium]|nr:glycoside hydrolase [Actinomycetota bacterium]